jgi:TRAP-type transport system small permease protein
MAMEKALSQPQGERSIIDDLPQVMGDDGEFHAQDEAVDLAGTPPEAWLALGFFWVLGLTVLYQFVTRYVFNDSASWTEEIARYLLIGTVFTGAAIGVVKNNHIQVDFFYRHLPAAFARWMARCVDVLRIAFFAAAVGLTIQMMLKLGNARMNLVYGVCLLGFAMMCARSIWVMRVHLRRGYTVLERPESTMEDRA